jgi:tetratricopeptide (TPR) repeat protein
VLLIKSAPSLSLIKRVPGNAIIPKKKVPLFMRKRKHIYGNTNSVATVQRTFMYQKKKKLKISIKRHQHLYCGDFAYCLSLYSLLFGTYNFFGCFCVFGMTTILGTYFTKEQLYADLKGKNIVLFFPSEYFYQQHALGDGIKVGTDVINKSRKGDGSAIYDIGLCYHNKSQFGKAIAWYLLAANIKSSTGQNVIGWHYYQGYGVPKNYLCALKWLLMAAKQNNARSLIHIANLLENGHGATLNKYKALEWFSQANNSAGKSRLKKQGVHRSGKDKSELHLAPFFFHPINKTI